MAQLKLVFPFYIGGQERVTCLETPVERTLACASFALPYDLNVDIPGARLVRRSYEGASSVYVFEFASLDTALAWMDDGTVHVEYGNRSGDLKKIENEMNAFMEGYESRERKSKRRMVKDEDGFVHYE